MIITILPSSANFHAVAYNEMKVEKGMATLLEAQNIYGLRQENYTSEKLRQFFMDYSSRNTHIQNAQFHVAVSCKGNEYSHQQLLDVAHRYLKEMGYAEEGQPLLIYAHHDTPNNHIHIVTSRVAPDGHKIDHTHEKRRSREITLKIMEKFEGRRQEPEVSDIVKEALAYRYTSKAQFCAIMESLGYDCKDDDEKPVVHIYRGGQELGTIQVQLIMQHALRDNKPDDKRRMQLRAILKKYRDLSANKEELAAAMRKKFGISLVFVGKADTPYGYIVVDHKNKTVFKGGEFLSIRELLQFEDAATHFTKIKQTIDDLLSDNPTLTTADINRILYRQSFIVNLAHESTEAQCRGTVRPSNCVLRSLSSFVKTILSVGASILHHTPLQTEIPYRLREATGEVVFKFRARPMLVPQTLTVNGN